LAPNDYQADLTGSRIGPTPVHTRSIADWYSDSLYWVRFQYPFWWNNLVAALDSVSLIGIPHTDPDVERGLDWLIRHQHKDGLWNLTYTLTTRGRSKRVTHRRPAAAGTMPANASEMRLWITLAICRILRRYYDLKP